MSAWRDQITAKAKIIQSQLDAAKNLSVDFGGSAEDVLAPYLAMLERLYSEELPLAVLLDESDLVARFDGPALVTRNPSIGLVSGMFGQLRGEVRSIAKSIAGLSNMRGATWPAHLDPNLSGIAKGSFIVGITVPTPGDLARDGQATLEGFDESVLKSVRDAVKSIPVMARFVGPDRLDAEVNELFPDPAIRDAVMVSARRLSPTGKKGIDSVSFMSEQGEKFERPLTPQSRLVLSQALIHPIKDVRRGEFSGTVREIDLDARRFEIRGVAEGPSALRCIYSSQYDDIAHKLLDSLVTVTGEYEVAPNNQPRLLVADNIKILKRRPDQGNIF